MSSMFICRTNAITLSCRFECLTHHCSVRLSFVSSDFESSQILVIGSHLSAVNLLTNTTVFTEALGRKNETAAPPTAFPALKQKQKDPVSIETLMARQNQCKLFCDYEKYYTLRPFVLSQMAKQTEIALKFQKCSFHFFRHLE